MKNDAPRADTPETPSVGDCPTTRRVAFYARTSSEDQRERETIKTQIEALQRAFSAAPDPVVLVGEFFDDGVSGTLAMEDRGQGRRLLELCARSGVDEVWVTRPNRIGRKTVHILNAVEAVEGFGAIFVGVLDPLDSKFMLTIKAAVAEEERRVFLENSAAGMARAARDGRYCGGVASIGFKVEGKKPNVFLVPSDVVMWGEKTDADIVRWIFHLIGVEGWSTRRVAAEFNRLGVPTAYQKDGRSVRKKATQGIWRAGRVLAIVRQPAYKGEHHYGRKSKHEREVIITNGPALVTEELWRAAQATLAHNRLYRSTPNNSYLLKSVMQCGLCGLTLCGAAGRPGVYWYRCNGQIVERGPIEGRCPSRSVMGPGIDETVWQDIVDYLRNPGDVLSELAAEMEEPDQPPSVSASDLRKRVVELEAEWERAKSLALKGLLDDDDLAAARQRRDSARTELESRLAALEAIPPRPTPEAPEDLLATIRQRLGELTPQERQHVVQALVKKVTVHTTRNEAGKKELRIVIEYRFPGPDTAFSGVVLTSPDTGSWRRRAKSWPET